MTCSGGFLGLFQSVEELWSILFYDFASGYSLIPEHTVVWRTSSSEAPPVGLEMKSVSSN